VSERSLHGGYIATGILSVLPLRLLALATGGGQ